MNAPIMYGIYVLFPSLFLFCFFWFTYSRQQLDKYSPKNYPIVGCLFEFLNNKNRSLEWITPYILSSPTNTVSVHIPGDKFIFTANPAHVERILKTKFDIYPKGDFFISNLHDLVGDGVFNTDGDAWKVQRKVASMEFSTKSLRDYLIKSLSEECEKRLVPLLNRASKENIEVDFQDVLYRFAFDNICKLSFGVDPACLDLSFPRNEFAEALDKATELSGKRFLAGHPLEWKIKRAFGLGSEKELKKAIKSVDDFAFSVIQKRREALSNSKGGNQFRAENPDLMSRFMAMEDSEWVGTHFTSPDKFLRDIVISFILAGRDTSSANLTWFFWFLSLNPTVEQRIYEEVGKVAWREERISPFEGFTFEDLKDMHYLHAALYESLRLYPVLPLDTKSALEDDVWEDGTVVKKGMRVVYHPYAMGRSEKIWGKDCLEYKPERWIEDGRFKDQSPYKFANFQAGPRICLGKEMATVQMKYVAATCILNYHVMVAEGFKAQYDLKVTMGIKGGLPAKIKKRS